MSKLYPWQHESWQSLQGLRGRLPHAILLKGAEGIGKLELARNFANSLLCESPHPDGVACGKCHSCHWFVQESHPDFRLVQPEALSLSEELEEKSTSGKKPSREISVNQIRELASFANLSAHLGGYRIVVIHPAESMNHNAANSLLKTLEEPTSDLIFILVTSKPQQLLPTIRSRCLSLAIHTPRQELGVAWLASQGIKDANQVLAQSGFSPLLAFEWANSGVGAEERATLLPALQSPYGLDAMHLADKLQRSELVHVIHCLQQWISDLFSCQLAGVIRYFPDQEEKLRELAGRISNSSLMRFQQELLDARRSVFHPLNPKLFLESLFLSYRQLFAS